MSYGQLVPQYAGTSLTQILSHWTEQQYGSAAQTSPAHVLHELLRGTPVVHVAWAQLPPPPLLLPPELLPLLLPEELPPELLPPPVQLVPQYVGTSLTQMLSHFTWQQ